jgi:hypothetical protein
MYIVNEGFEQSLQGDINRYVLLPWIYGIVYEYYVPKVNIPQNDTVKTKADGRLDFEKWMGIFLTDSELKSFVFGELNHLEEYGKFCLKVAKTYKLAPVNIRFISILRNVNWLADIRSNMHPSHRRPQATQRLSRLVFEASF